MKKVSIALVKQSRNVLSKIHYRTGCGDLACIIEAARRHRRMVTEFPWERRYRVSDMENVLTAALVVYPEVVASNIARALHLLGGNAESLAGAH
jgi:hypothetical protein